MRYLKNGALVAKVNETAPLVIEAELRGERLPPAGPNPEIAGRVGLELNPVDLGNPDDRDWLRALIWPDQGERLKRMDRAIALFLRERPKIVAGDALALLPDALACVPERQVPCVYHTIVLYQFSHEMRQALDDMMIVASLRRPLWRLSFEYDGDIYLLSAICYQDGERTVRRLASSHPHGTWLEWLA